MQQVHQWLVKKGRLAISSNSSAVILEVDPEGSEACLLTPQDAHEVAEILTDHARTIWESGPQTEGFKPTYEALSTSEYRWSVGSGELLISAAADKPEISIRCTAANHFHLTVGQTVEIIQVIQQLLGQLPKPGATHETPPATKPVPGATKRKAWWRI